MVAWAAAPPAPPRAPAVSLVRNADFSFDETYFSDDVLFSRCGKECGGEIVFLYCDNPDSNGHCLLQAWHPLMVRVVSVRDESSGDGHHSDWISICDTKPYGYNVRRCQIIPLSSREQYFTFPTASSLIHKYRYTMQIVTGSSGQQQHWIRLSTPDGTFVAKTSDGRDAFTVESLLRARAAQAALLNDQFQVENSFYYVVPQGFPCRCNQLLEITPDNRAGKVAGVACVRRKSDDGSLELLNGGHVELGYVLGPPDYYCVRPRDIPNSGWEAYTGADCRVHMDKFCSAKP
jgi:hypothetical protein